MVELHPDEPNRKEYERKRNAKQWKFINGSKMYESNDPAREADQTIEIMRKLCCRHESMEENVRIIPKENIERVEWRSAKDEEAY